MDINTLYFAIGYTLICSIVSGYYFMRGQAEGIKMVLITLKEEEPEMSKLFIQKIQKKLGLEEEAS